MNNKETMGQTNKVEIGVIGAGHLGRYHIECLQRIEGFSLIGFYDSDPVRAKEIADKYEIRSFDNVATLMDKVTALCIVTPTSTHFDLAVAAIESGKHLFIEKPLTDHPDTSRKLADLIASRQLVGRVGHVERYNPAFIAAQKMGIDKPVFIEAHRLAPFNPRGMDVPVVMDLMIHDIDLVLSMVDAEVDHIEANGVGVAGKSADICNARITFKNDTVANLTASRISLKQMRKLRLFQRDQYMAVDFLNHEVQVVKLFHAEPQDMMTMKLELPEGDRWIAADNPVVTKHNAIELELREFCDAIHNNDGKGVSFEQGARAVDVASRILQQIIKHEK
jgi:predicted dehydrogenase